MTTTHQAIGRGGREAWLPTQQPWAIDAIVAGGAVGASAGVGQLWKTGHHRQAVWITVAVVAVHSAAAIQNRGVR